MDAKPFSDEEIKDRHVRSEQFKVWLKAQSGSDELGFMGSLECRFLATIAADRKRIEGLEKENETLRTHFLSQITELRAFIEPAKKTLEKAMHVVCNNDPEQENAAVTKIEQQAATIDRLQGALEYYANDFNWSQRDWNDPEGEPQVVLYPGDPMKHGYEPARQALGKEE